MHDLVWYGVKFPCAVMYDLKMKYDESDYLVIRASRAVTDRLGDAFGGVVTQSDMAEALAEICKIDPSFNKEEFVKQCQFEIVPSVLEAFLRGDSAALQDWCHEPVSAIDSFFLILSVVIYCWVCHCMNCSRLSACAFMRVTHPHTPTHTHTHTNRHSMSFQQLSSRETSQESNFNLKCLKSEMSM